MFGPLIVEDSHGYLDYAHALRDGVIPAGAALLGQAPVPPTLFRIGGYPAVLALLQEMIPGHWLSGLLLLQVMAQTVVAAGCYVTARALGIGQRLAMLSSLLPSTGFVVVAEISVLSDALSSALITGAALILLMRPRFSAIAAAALCLAFATTMREATVFVAVAFVPLAYCLPGSVRRRSAAACILVLLPGSVFLGQMGWNVARGVGPVVTTSRQTVMIQAVLPLLREGYPVYGGDNVFDATARATVVVGGYPAIDDMHRRLFEKGFTAPDIASVASQRYLMAWIRFPVAMTRATAGNLRASYLSMPFQPFSTSRDLFRFAGHGWPGILGDSHRSVAPTDHVPAFWVLADRLTRSIGIAIALLGGIGPWLLRGARQLRALWCACAGLIAVYLPVHIEPRYIIPVIPLVSLMAAAVLTRVFAGKGPAGTAGDPAARVGRRWPAVNRWPHPATVLVAGLGVSPEACLESPYDGAGTE